MIIILMSKKKKQTNKTSLLFTYRVNFIFSKKMIELEKNKIKQKKTNFGKKIEQTEKFEISRQKKRRKKNGLFGNVKNF